MPFLVGESVALNNTFLVGVTPTDPTAVTLVITDPAGVATTYNWPALATITRTGVGVFTKTITATTAGTWVYVWTGTGSASDIAPGYFVVAGVGATYVNLGDIRSLPNLSDAAKFTAAEVNAAIDWFESTFEDYTGVAWLPRTVTDERHYTTSADTIILDHMLPRTITAVRAYSTSAVSTAYTASELADLRLDGSGVLRRVSLGRFTSGFGLLAIDYTHGHPSPPSDVVEAAKVAIAEKLKADHTARQPYLVATEGLVTRFSRPGPGRPFGLDDVDEVANRRRSGAVAIA